MMHRNKKLPVALCLVMGSALMGCTVDQEVVRQKHTDLFYQEPTDEVDILWVIDNSISMNDEQVEVGAKFQDFISNLEETGVDFHLGVVTTDLDDPDHNGKLQGPEGEPLYLSAEVEDYQAKFSQRVQVGIDGSDREKGIGAVIKALSEPLVSSYNSGFLRDGATLSVIFVSDENDCTDDGELNKYESAMACYDHSDELVRVKDLLEAYEALKSEGERILVSGVVGPEITENCDGAKPGFRYEAMADAFGGIKGSICDQDFSVIMDNLGLQVSGEMTSFQLTYSAIEDSMEVLVDDQAVDKDSSQGWTYDPQYAILYFHGDAIPPRGAQIAVEYEVAGSGIIEGD
jgi:hypothetical protein